MADEELREGWEYYPKHFFILSSAGKPIFTRHGDEQEMVTTFGLLQAVISIAQDSGDNIRCIKAGQRRIVYFIKDSLYFICISSTGEAEVVLTRQLQFMYRQILFVLTGKVHDVLRNNPSKDLRDLLGTDTNGWFAASCQDDLTLPCIAFDTVRGYMMAKEDRTNIVHHLKYCVETSGAVLGILMNSEGALIACSGNGEAEFVLEDPDILLLTHFVSNSTSLKTHDQNWVPLCLPTFNSSAYLQAYVAKLQIGSKLGNLPSPPAMSSAAPTPTGAVSSSNNMMMETPSDPATDVIVILIAAASDADTFKDLHRGRNYIQQYLTESSIGEKLATLDRERKVSEYLTSSLAHHFLFKHTPSSKRPRGGPRQTMPAQCIWSPFTFPFNMQDSQSKIWCHYQRLYASMICGSCTTESTLPLREFPTGHNRSDNTDDDSPSMVQNTTPSPNHSLSYIVMDPGGQIAVGLATPDTCLFAVFPSTVGTLEACNQASILSRTIKGNLPDLFQTSSSVSVGSR